MSGLMNKDLLKNKSLLFIPVNSSNNKSQLSADQGAHWSLLIYSVVEKCFIHLDSIPGYNTKTVRTLAGRLKRFLLLDPHCQVHDLRVPPQSNASDCGIHVALYAELALAHYEFKGSLLDLPPVELQAPAARRYQLKVSLLPNNNTSSEERRSPKVPSSLQRLLYSVNLYTLKNCTLTHERNHTFNAVNPQSTPRSGVNTPPNPKQGATVTNPNSFAQSNTTPSSSFTQDRPLIPGLLPGWVTPPVKKRRPQQSQQHNAVPTNNRFTTLMNGNRSATHPASSRQWYDQHQSHHSHNPQQRKPRTTFFTAPRASKSAVIGDSNVRFVKEQFPQSSRQFWEFSCLPGGTIDRMYTSVQSFITQNSAKHLKVVLHVGTN